MATGGFSSARILSQGFHDEVIRPLLTGIPYAAGLLGWGSDVLGYDTERSTDHGWGPRLHVFVDAHQVEQVATTIDTSLPSEYRGYAVRFGWDTQQPVHHITVTTVDAWLKEDLGVLNGRHLTLQDWLVTPQQKLLGVVAGIAQEESFAQLGQPDGLDRDLEAALAANTLPERERALTTAYRKVAVRHNALKVTEAVDPEPHQYFDRPAMVLGAGRFAGVCLAAVRDPRVQELGLIGTIDQFADNTDVLSNPAVYRKLISIYEK